VDKVVIKDPFKYHFSIDIELVINFKRFIKTFDIYDQIRNRFEDSQISLDVYTDDKQCWSWLFTLVYGSVQKNRELFEEGNLFNTKFNKQMEDYISLIYSKLPRNLVVLEFNGDEELYQEVLPSTYEYKVRDTTKELFKPKVIEINCFKVSPGSASDLLGGM
jgi:hypothetical protein